MTESTPGIVLVEDRGPVRIVTMNRPEKLNALNGALIEGLTGALEAAAGDREVVAVVLTGAGRAFSAGADLSAARVLTRETRQALIAHADASIRLMGLAGRIAKPVVAAVKGYALGAGASLAISADMVVAGTGARFGYPELQRGLAATHVGAHLAHLAGPKAAFELLMLCEQIGAERAQALGLVNRVVPDERVVEEAVAIAAAMAAFDRDALWHSKRVFRRALELSAPQAMDMARDVSMMLARLPE